MLVSEYQQSARTTAIYPAAATVYYTALGLCGESGEIANKVKKILRGDVTLEQRRDDLRGELGDVLWYVSGVASDLGLNLKEIARAAANRELAKRDLYGYVLMLNSRAGVIADRADDWRANGASDRIRNDIASLLEVTLAICAAIAAILETDLETVCHDNIKKLFARKEAGTIKGDGDNR